MTNFHNRKASSNLEELREMKKRKKEFDHSFGFSKAAVNNFMNNSQNKEDHSPFRGDQISRPSDSRERKHKKKSNSKLATFGGDKNKVLKELLQLKEGNIKMQSKNEKTSKDHSDREEKIVTKSGNNFKKRKPSEDQSRSDRNPLKDAKASNRSRKSQSSKPTDRASRADDSRDTSTRSNKEDSKSGFHNDKPANNQVADSGLDKEIV